MLARIYKFPNENIYDNVDKEEKEDMIISNALKNSEKNCLWNIIKAKGISCDLPKEKRNYLILDIYNYLLDSIDE